MQIKSKIRQNFQFPMERRGFCTSHGNFKFTSRKFNMRAVAGGTNVTFTNLKVFST